MQLHVDTFTVLLRVCYGWHGVCRIQLALMRFQCVPSENAFEVASYKNNEATMQEDEEGGNSK